MDGTPGGYSNSKAVGSRWAVRTSQGRMDMRPLLLFLSLQLLLISVQLKIRETQR